MRAALPLPASPTARRVRAIALAALLLAVAAAGCAAPAATLPAPAPAAPPAVTAVPIVQDHDHADRHLHNQSENLRLVAHVKPWGDGSAYGEGTVNEFAINGHHVYVSRSNPEGGFAIVDLADPTDPRVVGDYRSEGGADIEVTSDGAYALLMTQRTVPGEQTVDNPLSRAPRGIYVVDVTDKSRPTRSSFFPLPTNGPHTAHYHLAADGREIVTIQTYDIASAPAGSAEGTNPATQRIWLTELVRDAAGARLVQRGVYQVATPAPAGALYFPHDAHVETHPLDGRLLMSVAYWDAGVRIVDVTDLARPREIASFSDFAPSQIVGMHDVRPFPTLQDGRHVTVASPEIVTADEVGQVTFVDTTDPEAPVKLGWWSLSDELVVDQPFLFSPHVLDTHASGMVVIGHNHAGVWLIDARDKGNATSAAYYMPHEERPGFVGVQPSVWGARFYGQHVLATDGPTGLYVLEPAPGLLERAPPGVPAANLE